VRRLALLVFLVLAAPAAAAPHPVQIAHGHTRFGSFSISGYTSGGLLCVSLDARALSDAGCGFTLLGTDVADPDTTGDCGHHRLSLLGIASDRVAGVRFRYASGRTLPTRLYPLPSALASRTQVYVAFAGSARGLRWLDAYDAAGRRILHRRQGSSSAPCSFVDPFKGSPVVATGQAPDGGQYQFRAARSPDEFGHLNDCLGVKERHSAGGKLEGVGLVCDERIGDADARVFLAGSCKSAGETFYFGFAAPTARSVALLLDDGRTITAQLYPAPAAFHTADPLVLAAVTGAHRVRSVTGYDAGGAQVFTHKAASEKGGLCDGGGTFGTEVQLDG
jgi:hypothetical protein